MSPRTMRTKSAWGGMFPKPTILRLKGDQLSKLREACLKRDGGLCVCCGRPVTDSVPDWHPRKYDMIHKRSRGAGGEDVLDNVETGCHECHMREHAGGKPCTPKPRVA